MAGGWVGVSAGFDGLVRRWRRSAWRPNAAGGRGHVARADAVLHRHLLYARTGAAQRAARLRRHPVPAARNRYSRRFVQVNSEWVHAGPTFYFWLLCVDTNLKLKPRRRARTQWEIEQDLFGFRFGWGFRRKQTAKTKVSRMSGFCSLRKFKKFYARLKYGNIIDHWCYKCGCFQTCGFDFLVPNMTVWRSLKNAD